MPRVVAVVGGKHSGKTAVIENLIAELKRRRYSVGVIKEMARVLSLDTPQKETDRYSQAGAEEVVAVPKEETVIFIKKRLSIQEILPYLGGLDFVLLEGFESEKAIPKIIAAKNFEEAKKYSNSSVLAISGLIAESDIEIARAKVLGIKVFNSSTQSIELVNLVEITTNLSV